MEQLDATLRLSLDRIQYSGYPVALSVYGATHVASVLGGGVLK